MLQRGLTCISERRTHVLTAYDGDLSTVTVPRLDGPVSPSRLESWVTCPHAYFAHYLLEVDPIEEPDDEISITARDEDRPTTTHSICFHRAVIDGSLPQPTTTGWTDEHRAALSAAFDEVCERTQRRGRTGRPAFWADERDRMRADLLGVARSRQRSRPPTRFDRARVGDALRWRRRGRHPSAGRPGHRSCRGRSTASTAPATARSWSPTTRPAARPSSRICRPTIRPPEAPLFQLPELRRSGTRAVRCR